MTNILNKKIYDYVHGFIRFDEIEKKIINSSIFQRLRYIHQMGINYLVFPGATHTRFEHSLGVMEIATKIYDKICMQQNIPSISHLIPRQGSNEYYYWRRMLRMSALLHDIGHLPFSHTAEDSVLQDNGHEKKTYQLLQHPILEKIFNEIKEKPFLSYGVNRNVQDDVIKLTLGKRLLKKYDSHLTKFTSWEDILFQIINGDLFCADRIDYLLRDARCTGTVYGIFDYRQLIEMLRIIPINDNFELGIDENGLESGEEFFLSRYFMHKRVYQNSSTKAFNFHLKRFITYYYKKANIQSIDSYIKVTDIDILKDLMTCANTSSHPNYNDAKCIIERKKHFKAMCLPKHNKEEDLQEFKETNSIEDAKIEWDFSQKKDHIHLNFLVIRYHTKILKAKSLSNLLSNLPSISNNWVYLSPEYELLFINKLNSFD